MQQDPVRFQRIVSGHKRKDPIHNRQVQVRDYVQGYYSPRGKIGSVNRDPLTKYSQTIWLKDRQGHFIGRANYEGKTTAQGATSFGYDNTTTVRDTKRFKRVFGRVRSEKGKSYSYR